MSSPTADLSQLLTVLIADAVVGCMLVSAAMGAVGGLLPALRAARIPAARALRDI